MAHAEFCHLRCNFPLASGEVCGKVILEGWATQCSHLFCQEHTQEWFETDSRCPICLDKQKDVRMVKVGAAKDEHPAHLQQVLHARSPSDIQAAANSAIAFWVFQKQTAFEHKRRSEEETCARVKKLIMSGRKRLTEAEALKKSLLAGTQELRRQLRQVEQEVLDGKKDCAKLEAKIAEARRAYRDAFSQAAGLTPRPAKGGGGAVRDVHDGSSFRLHRTPVKTDLLRRSPQNHKAAGIRKSPQVHRSLFSANP